MVNRVPTLLYAALADIFPSNEMKVDYGIKTLQFARRYLNL